MAKAKEFTVTIEDKPGALAKCLLALAERGVNVLAFQSYVEEGESLCRFVADDMATAKQVLGNLHMIFEETNVVVIRLAHRPGELGRAAAKLGKSRSILTTRIWDWSRIQPERWWFLGSTI